MDKQEIENNASALSSSLKRKNDDNSDTATPCKQLKSYAVCSKDGRFIRLGNFVVDSLKTMHNENLIFETIQNIRNVIAMAMDRDAIPTGSDQQYNDLTTKPILYDFDTNGYFE